MPAGAVREHGFEWIDATPCGDLTSQPVSGQAFLWLIVNDSGLFDATDGPSGLSGAQFGITHDLSPQAWRSVGLHRLRSGLPVVLEYFRATPTERGVLAEWATCRMRNTLVWSFSMRRGGSCASSSTARCSRGTTPGVGRAGRRRSRGGIRYLLRAAEPRWECSHGAPHASQVAAAQAWPRGWASPR